MVDGRLRRIALVTRHYGALRAGVTRAICALGLIAVGVLELLNESFIPRPSPLGLFLVLANIFGMAAVIGVLWFFAWRWMNRRFGRVRSANPLRTAWGINILTFTFLAVSQIDDRYGIGTGLPSWRFLLVAAYGVWVCVRRWPLAIHYLVPTAVALAFAAVHTSLRDEAAYDAWELRAYVVTLLAWTTAGLVDLALLLKVLPDRRAEQIHADAS